MIRYPLGLAFAVAASATQAAPRIAGNWIIEDKSAVVAIEPCGGRLCGRIAKGLIRRPGYPQTDVHNPIARLRGRPLIGLTILRGFVPKADRWDKGKIYDPESGRTYRSVLKLNADGTLKVSGCIMVFCRSQRWTRLP